MNRNLKALLFSKVFIIIRGRIILEGLIFLKGLILFKYLIIIKGQEERDPAAEHRDALRMGGVRPRDGPYLQADVRERPRGDVALAGRARG